MMRTYYIVSHGKLFRKENTVYFIDMEGEKSILPVNKIESIHVFSKVSLSSGIISLFAEKGIVMHFFNKYGYYESTLYPRERLVSGMVVVKQAEHYLDKDKRMYLAKEFIMGSTCNIMRNLKRWKFGTGKIEEKIKDIENADTIPKLMEVEGKIREEYYKIIDENMPEEFRMLKRERRPPTNRMNALISFGNALVYSTILTEIYHTQLNPTISYLHEPSERRFSLSLDLAEIFKPIIIDRIVIKMIRLRMLDDSDFRNDLNCVLLSEKGKRKFIAEYDKRLESTIKHRGLKRKVSIKRMIRMECYKLIKHIIGATEYKALVAWW